MKSLPVIGIAVLAIIGGVLAYSLIMRNKGPSEYQLVKQVCQYSRSVTNGQLEEACGELQDATKTKFSCDSFKVDAKCKVEAATPEVLIYPKTEGENITAENVMTATNKTREGLKLSKLAMNQDLRESACLKLDNMVAENYWGHYSPSGVDPWYWITLSDYKYRAAAENLAYGQTTTSELINQWLDSPKHREALLKDIWTDQGVCTKTVFFQGSNTILTVHHFGQRR